MAVVIATCFLQLMYNVEKPMKQFNPKDISTIEWDRDTGRITIYFSQDMEPYEKDEYKKGSATWKFFDKIENYLCRACKREGVE